MKTSKLLSLLCMSALIISCGTGANELLPGQNYFSASYSSYYNIQQNNGQSYLTIVSPSQQWLNNAFLTPIVLTANESQYTFNQGGASGIVTIKNNNLTINYTSTSSTWIDFATQNIGNSLPDGTYNLICDQTNLSACSMTINNDNISITEYSVTGQTTTLCNNSSANKASSNLNNPYIWTFTCSVNGGSSSGIWHIMPMMSNNTTSLLIAEYNPTSNINNDATDEIAFQQPSTNINPSGTYVYTYNGGSFSGGVGTSTAMFSGATLANSIVGLCNGSACALIPNQYYNNQAKLGFDWYNVNGLNNYNLVGSDAQNIYQDSFEGFYF